MNTVPTIARRSITGIDAHPKHPVYFVHLNGSTTPSIVVKGEHNHGRGLTRNETVVSIKWSSKLMKNVNHPLVNSKIMTDDEVSIFKAFATMVFRDDRRQNVILNEPLNWVKMPMVAGLTDADFWSETTNQPVPRLMRETIQNFVKDAVWYELGKVVAVDIFNGNSDRFDFATGQWVNRGNVMFVNSGGRPNIVGLDTFDAQGGHASNLASVGNHSGLTILIDESERKRFALACTRSVGGELQRGLQRKSINQIAISFDELGGHTIDFPADAVAGMFEPWADKFGEGIRGGALHLKQYLQNKVRQYAPWKTARRPEPATIGLRRRPRTAQSPVIGEGRGQRKSVPQGILDRMAALGWNAG